MATRLQDGQTLLFIGDSITDCDRRGAHYPLGNGYVWLFNAMLVTREPSKKIRIINKGIGGDTVWGLRERWGDDVLRHRPDWLSIKIGINDLHRRFSERGIFGEPIMKLPPDVFEEHYDNILSRTQSALPKCKILLIDPFYMSIDSTPGTRRREVLEVLPQYHAVVHKLSRKYKTRLIKTHELMRGVLKHHDADLICPEPVHPNTVGHLLIADAVYQAFSR